MNEFDLIKVILKRNANKVYYYPNNATSIGVAKLLDQKTLTDKNLEHLKEIGFKIEVLNHG